MQQEEKCPQQSGFSIKTIFEKFVSGEYVQFVELRHEKGGNNNQCDWDTEIDLDEAKTVSRLWNDVRSGTENPPGFTFDWFVLALDLLFAMGAIDQSGGRIGRRTAEPGDRP